jgi:hypothetical protein
MPLDATVGESGCMTSSMAACVHSHHTPYATHTTPQDNPPHHTTPKYIESQKTITPHHNPAHHTTPKYIESQKISTV